MKKIISTLCIIVFIAVFATAAQAQDEIKFAWEQEVVEAVDGWRLYKAGVSGGPYEQVTEILKTEPAAEYTAAVPKSEFSGPVFFIVRAFNEGGESDDSNEVTNIFRPGAPVILRIILE